ncbi:MAG: rhodanese-like domain-containing protein [Elusimicrobia bacterium]|nr:rhodanese-like domain-containing protein [Elusimicrobiota bacterium]
MAPNPDTKTVTTEELNDGLNMGSSLQVVNVLGREFSSLGMIRYSRRIPFSEFERRFAELDKGRAVVTYCSGEPSRSCRMAADFLTEKGYKVSAYPGGLTAWRAAGLPMEVPAAP